MCRVNQFFWLLCTIADRKCIQARGKLRQADDIKNTDRIMALSRSWIARVGNPTRRSKGEKESFKEGLKAVKNSSLVALSDRGFSLSLSF